MRTWSEHDDDVKRLCVDQIVCFLIFDKRKACASDGATKDDNAMSVKARHIDALINRGSPDTVSNRLREVRARGIDAEA